MRKERTLQAHRALRLPEVAETGLAGAQDHEIGAEPERRIVEHLP